MKQVLTQLGPALVSRDLACKLLSRNYEVSELISLLGPQMNRPSLRGLKTAWLRQRAEQVSSYVSRNLYKVSADMIDQGTQGRFGIR